MNKVLKSASLIIFSVVMLLFSGCSGKGTPALSFQADASHFSEEAVFGIKMDESAGVVLESIADVFAEPDIKSDRVTQVICNQPVSILEESGGWLLVDTVDGSRGWINSKNVIKDVSSVFGRTYFHKIVVTGKEKSLYSNASGGVTVLEAAMGSVFLAFNESGAAYEVYLPGNRTGWISGSGIIHVNKNDAIPVTYGGDFVASALKFKGTSYLYNGAGPHGIDSAGLNYTCAFVNGVKLPRTLEKQAEYGEDVDLENVRPGDIIFFHDPKSDGKVAFSGIVRSGDSLIYCNSTVGYVKVGSLSDAELKGYGLKAKRIF
jgi:hypothetical protein